MKTNWEYIVRKVVVVVVLHAQLFDVVFFVDPWWPMLRELSQGRFDATVPDQDHEGADHEAGPVKAVGAVDSYHLQQAKMKGELVTHFFVRKAINLKRKKYSDQVFFLTIFLTKKR